MPHTKSAKKRLRQDEKRRLLNKATRTRMKTESKKFLQLLEAGDLEGARAQLAVAMSRIDKAAKKNVIHANTAARKKSLLARRLREAEQGTG